MRWTTPIPPAIAIADAISAWVHQGVLADSTGRRRGMPEVTLVEMSTKRRLLADVLLGTSRTSSNERPNRMESLQITLFDSSPGRSCRRFLNVLGRWELSRRGKRIQLVFRGCLAAHPTLMTSPSLPFVVRHDRPYRSGGPAPGHPPPPL